MFRVAIIPVSAAVYSLRSATAGSTSAARRAGAMQQVIEESLLPNVCGSVAATPYNMPRKTFVSVAPSAMRIPNSRVRRATR